MNSVAATILIDSTALPRLVGDSVTPWSFVYVFFSNGTPFDAPNRSETCPLA
jgi:hypothetical protein